MKLNRKINEQIKTGNIDFLPVNLILVIGLNPFSLVPELARWIFFDNNIYIDLILYNLIFTFFFFILSMYLFIKNEKNIADLL